MRRYRVFGVDFDSRPYILSMEIKDEWEETVKDGHRRNKEQQQQAFVKEFGEYYAEQKTQDFIELDKVRRYFTVVRIAKRLHKASGQDYGLPRL